MKKPLTPEAKFAVASLVCGIAAIAYPACITGPIGSVAAIILGILGVKSEKRCLAIAGIVLAGLSLAMLALLAFLEYRHPALPGLIFASLCLLLPPCLLACRWLPMTWAVYDFDDCSAIDLHC